MSKIVKYDLCMEGNTWMRVGIEFLLEFWTWYLTSKRREMTNFIPKSSHLLFCLLHKISMANYFDGFPKISGDFSKISWNSPRVLRRQDNRFRFNENFRRLKTSENNRRFSRKAYSNISKYLICKGLCNHSNGELCSNHGDPNVFTSETSVKSSIFTAHDKDMIF